MAGYGNRNAPDLNPTDLEEQHSNTHYDLGHHNAYHGGHDTYGSGATGGAGFGNKSTLDNTDDYNNSDLRFGSHQNTEPYSGGTKHKSGTVGGAGYGNKTGSHGEKNDSAVGKLMEKAGHVMHNENLAEKGRVKREQQGFGQSEE